MRGIFCVDPGESTGLAWGIVDDHHKGMAFEAVKERLHSSSKTITGSERDQIRLLYQGWTAFKRFCVERAQLEPTWVDLVVEDFVLYPGERPGKKTTTPERIAWGFEGYRLAMLDSYRRSYPRHYSDIHWQKPGAAKRFTRREILRNANAWVIGKEHERTAFGHLILRTSILMDMHSVSKGRRP